MERRGHKVVRCVEGYGELDAAVCVFCVLRWCKKNKLARNRPDIVVVVAVSDVASPLAHRL